MFRGRSLHLKRYICRRGNRIIQTTNVFSRSSPRSLLGWERELNRPTRSVFPLMIAEFTGNGDKAAGSVIIRPELLKVEAE